MKNIYFISVLLFLAGCAATPRVQNMIVHDPYLHTKHSVSVSIGQKEHIAVVRDKYGRGNPIAEEDFLEAARISIQQSGLFSQVEQTGQADYQLFIDLLEVELRTTAWIGYGLTYTIIAKWMLIDTKSSRTIFNEMISADGHANTSDAFNGITRNTIARERAAQENIRKGIKQLAELKL